MGLLDDLMLDPQPGGGAGAGADGGLLGGLPFGATAGQPAADAGAASFADRWAPMTGAANGLPLWMNFGPAMLSNQPPAQMAGGAGAQPMQQAPQQAPQQTAQGGAMPSALANLPVPSSPLAGLAGLFGGGAPPGGQSPSIGDRLGAGLMGFTQAGSPMSALGNLIGGLATGQRQDPLAMAMRQQQQAPANPGSGGTEANAAMPSAAAPFAPAATPQQAPVAGARRAPDGNWYTPDPSRPGRYLRVR